MTDLGSMIKALCVILNADTQSLIVVRNCIGK